MEKIVFSTRIIDVIFGIQKRTPATREGQVEETLKIQIKQLLGKRNVGMEIAATDIRKVNVCLATCREKTNTKVTLIIF